MTEITGFSVLDRASEIKAAPMVVITADDRLQFGAALVLQGYQPIRAAQMARELAPNDGALQMLARHRIAYERERA